MGIAKLDEAKVKQIKQRILDGEKQGRIAKDYGISQCCVSRIKRGYEWSWVEPDISHLEYCCWSLRAPKMAQIVCKLYLQGYSEYAIGPIVRAIITNMPPDKRPNAKKVSQPEIHRILVKYGVKRRNTTKRIPKRKINRIYKMIDKGIRCKMIAEKLGLGLSTVWHYSAIYNKSLKSKR